MCYSSLTGGRKSRCDFGDFDAEVLESNLGYGKYDLNLLVQAIAAGFMPRLVYNLELYDPETIEQMMGHLQT